MCFRSGTPLHDRSMAFEEALCCELVSHAAATSPNSFCSELCICEVLRTVLLYIINKEWFVWHMLILPAKMGLCTQIIKYTSQPLAPILWSWWMVQTVDYTVGHTVTKCFATKITNVCVLIRKVQWLYQRISPRFKMFSLTHTS